MLTDADMLKLRSEWMDDHDTKLTWEQTLYAAGAAAQRAKDATICQMHIGHRTVGDAYDQCAAAIRAAAPTGDANE